MENDENVAPGTCAEVFELYSFSKFVWSWIQLIGTLQRIVWSTSSLIFIWSALNITAVKKHPEDSMFQDSSESDEKHSKYIESSEFEQYIEFLSKIELLWEQSEEKQSCRGRLDMLTHQNLDL